MWSWGNYKGNSGTKAVIWDQWMRYCEIGNLDVGVRHNVSRYEDKPHPFCQYERSDNLPRAKRNPRNGVKRGRSGV